MAPSPLFLAFVILCFLLPTLPFSVQHKKTLWLHPEKPKLEPGKQVNQGRVFGGRKAKGGDYPFMASIQIKTKHFCGASIISNQIILTAAHCWLPPRRYKNVRIMVGFHKQRNHHVLVKDGLNRHFEIDKWVRHEKYKETKDHKGYLGGYDVALIKLKRPIEFERFGAKKVAQICLPSEWDVPEGDECEVIGWGWTEVTYGGKGRKDVKDDDHTLRSVNVKTVRQSVCLNYFPIKKKDDFICTSEFKAGACGGDSGGPYICPVKGDSNTWLQFGITSFGATKCKDAPSVYTRVNVYTDWIVETAEKLLSPKGTTAKRSTRREKNGRKLHVTLSTSLHPLSTLPFTTKPKMSGKESNSTKRGQ